eukprot:scaffold343630_cov20-Prasinocladus_malaysianus.AAC.1
MGADIYGTVPIGFVYKIASCNYISLIKDTNFFAPIHERLCCKVSGGFGCHKSEQRMDGRRLTYARRKIDQREQRHVIQDKKAAAPGT